MKSSKSHFEKKILQPLLHENNIIKGENFKFSSSPYVVGSKDAKHAAEPQINIIKEKEFVSAIEVKCVCGRTIHIDCK